MTTPSGAPPVLHRTADFRGLPAELLRDGAVISGLLLSAAAAAGLTTNEAPLVRQLPRDGVAVVLLLNLGHLTAHSIPERGVLLLDLLVPAGRDPQKAVDVFVRKFGLSESRNGRPDRG